MAYAEVTVIVDGVQESFDTFYDYNYLNLWLDEIREDALGHGYPTEVYVMYHEHAATEEECACAQYITDHHPAYSYNTGEDDK